MRSSTRTCVPGAWSRRSPCAADRGAYYLAYPADRPKPPRVEAFEDWLLGESLKMDEASAPSGMGELVRAPAAWDKA